MLKPVAIWAALVLAPAQMLAAQNDDGPVSSLTDETPVWYMCFSIDWNDGIEQGYVSEPAEVPLKTNEFWMMNQWEDTVNAYRETQGQKAHDFTNRCGYYLTRAEAENGMQGRLDWLPTRDRTPVKLPFTVDPSEEGADAPMPQLMTTPTISTSD